MCLSLAHSIFVKQADNVKLNRSQARGGLKMTQHYSGSVKGSLLAVQLKMDFMIFMRGV